MQVIGPAEAHDATILAVEHESDRCKVGLKACDGQLVGVLFSGVHEVAAHRAVGMMIYSIVELEASTPWQKFEFVNWDEKDDAYLRVAALAVSFARRET